MLKYKKTTLFFFYFMPLRSTASMSFRLFLILCYRFFETIFKIKLNTLTKYADTVTFNFAHIINCNWSIMLLKVSMVINIVGHQLKHEIIVT